MQHYRRKGGTARDGVILPLVEGEHQLNPHPLTFVGAPVELDQIIFISDITIMQRNDKYM